MEAGDHGNVDRSGEPLRGDAGPVGGRHVNYIGPEREYVAAQFCGQSQAEAILAAAGDTDGWN